MGRKKIDIDIKEVERLAGLGLTQEEIALSLGISERTLYLNKAQNAEFADAIKRGQTRANTEVANVLYQEALKGNMTAVIWWDKTRAGRSDKIAIDHSGKLQIEYVNDWRSE
jgi:hypothetical protein